MARYQDDSSDDEIGVNLQLAERLRINRGEQLSPSACEKKNLKNWYNQNRRRQVYDFSSSSSSLDMSFEPFSLEPSCSYGQHNKKRQNGDKSGEHFSNPKRTCLAKGLQRSPMQRKRRCEQSDMDSLNPLPSTPLSRNLLPDKMYEDYMKNVTDEEDSDFEPRKRIVHKGLQPGSSGSQNGSRSEGRRGKQYNPHNKGFQFADSTSEDESKSVIQNGALKGGRQSPDTVIHKKGPLRKLKKVLDSDSDKDWQVGSYLSHRSRALILSSSDSEDSENPCNGIAVPNSAAANLSFPSGDASISNQGQSYYCPDVLHNNGSIANNQYNAHLPSQSPLYRAKNSKRLINPQNPVLPPQPTVQITPIQNISISLHPGRDMTYSDVPSTSVDTPHSRHASNHYPLPIRFVDPKTKGVSRNNAPVTRSAAYDRHPIFTRGASAHDHSNLQSSLNPLDAHQQTGSVHGLARFRSNPVVEARPLVSQHRSTPFKLTRGRSMRGKANPASNLGSQYPDSFDAEESEVEFFTANSYSDNESSESVPDLVAWNPPVGTTQLSNPHLPTPDPINVASSEDEISVVYSRTNPMNNEQRRGSARTLGRRYNRRPSVRMPSPHGLATLSPDPVEQVRQVEEDERFARMLQAQFDAEVDPTYPPCLQTPRRGVEQEASGDSNSSEDSSDSFDMDPALDNNIPVLPPAPVHYPTPSINLFHGLNLRLGRHPNSLSLIFNPRARPARTRNTVGVRMLDLGQQHWDNNFLFDSFGPDSYEQFLGLAELSGDVPRGLQRSEINRLPTRNYVVPNAASSSGGSDVPHKRAELNKECQVCLNDYVNGDTLRILPCFHEFHTPCIDPWLKINHTCPVCRVVVDLQQ